MRKRHQIYSNRWFPMAPTGDKRSWAPRGAECSPSKDLARHEVGQCLRTWGTGESNQRNWHQQHQPFPRIGPARSFGETRSCDKGWSLGLWKHGFRHLLSQTVWLSTNHLEMVPRSQRVLKYLCRCGRWCLSSPVSFPCRGENISSLPRTLEKTNTFRSANAVWNNALIFGWYSCEPARLRRNDPFPCFHPSVGAPHDPASAWPAEDKSHRGSDRNPSRALLSRGDYQPLGSHGSELLAGEEENK